MNTSFLIKLIIIAFIFYLLVSLFFPNNYNNSKYNSSKKLTNDTNLNNSSKYIDDNISIDDIDNYLMFNNVNSNYVKIDKNNNFIDIKFHNDYRDVLTSFDNLTPDKRQIFNLANRPITYSEPNTKEVKNLVNHFVDILNNDIKNNVDNSYNSNSGWDEKIPQKKIESGWEKIQKSLGLPTSLYHDPKGKSSINVVNIDSVEKYEYDKEAKYKVKLVLQKSNSNDQLIITINFVVDKHHVNPDNFHFDYKLYYNTVIEHIYIIGYLSNSGIDNNIYSSNNINSSKFKNLYKDFQNMEHSDLTDPKKVQQVLLDKYKQKNKEISYRNSLFDEEGRVFHNDLPNVYDYDNIKNTQTIFDDMNGLKKFNH